MTASARDSPRRRWSSRAARAEGGGAWTSASSSPAWSAARSSRSSTRPGRPPRARSAAPAAPLRRPCVGAVKRSWRRSPDGTRRRRRPRRARRRTWPRRSCSWTAAWSQTSSAGRRRTIASRPGELERPPRRVEVAHVLDREPHDLQPAMQRMDQQPLALEPGESGTARRRARHRAGPAPRRRRSGSRPGSCRPTPRCRSASAMSSAGVSRVSGSSVMSHSNKR